MRFKFRSTARNQPDGAGIFMDYSFEVNDTDYFQRHKGIFSEA